MIRALLATTAVAAVLAVPVIAQDASSSMDSSMMSSELPMDTSSEMPMDTSSEMPMDTSSEMPMDMSSEVPMEMSSVEPTAPFDIISGYTRVDSDRLVTFIVGAPVYDGTAADANKLGDISDIVLDERGNAQAVIIGVGGFLGIGEKQVAVAYSALQWVVAADSTERFVVETTVDDLNAAPDFIVVDDASTADPMAPAAGTDTMAPADPLAPSSAAQ